MAVAQGCVLMDLGDDLGHLTYCLNIHRTETWAECRAALAGPVQAVKTALCPDAPFAVGLRISARALAELENTRNRQELKDILADGNLVPLTMNGFPYGPFHGVRVKEQVYQPDWRMDERLSYTRDLADLMADLAAPGSVISLSTVPGTFRPLGTGAEADMATRYIDAAAHCARLLDATGVTVALAIEPEPCCFLETIHETARYFQDFLYSPSAIERFTAQSGLAASDAPAALRRHLGLCYDVCHAAVEYEDPGESLELLRRSGIPIHKLQLSAALRTTSSPDTRRALAAYDEPTYLHQVLARQAGGAVKRHVDLAEALARGAEADGEEWRIHFHVPIFLSELGLFHSTQNFLSEILNIHRARPISAHLEVETYTWDVLPNDLRTETVEGAIARELKWVQKSLGR